MSYSVSGGDRHVVNPPIAAAMAILYRDGKFLMQLRDNIPGIAYPGVWGLFGGHLEPGEDPEVGLKRELAEEIDYTVTNVTEFHCYRNSQAIRHIFYAPLLANLNALELNEGWDLDLLSPADIRRGCKYSQRAREERLLGSIHRQILLDFLAKFEKTLS